MTVADEPGSPVELAAFERLQQRLPVLFREVFRDRLAPRTVVVATGISMDTEVLSRVTAVQHYEERQLSMLMLLRLPNTRLVFVTSQPLHPTIVDYYLELLPGVPTSHARDRLTLLSAYDSSAVSLTGKILDRPRLLERVRQAMGDPELAHLSVFNATPLERTLAVRLGIPLYACDPRLERLGSKSGSRKLFRDAGIPLPDGSEDLRDAGDIIAAIVAMRARNPALGRVVIKLDEGFAGEGNALLDLRSAPDGPSLEGWLRDALPARLVYVAHGEDWEGFSARFTRMQGIVEEFIEGEDKRSPSVQARINPLREIELLSTHDQILGGEQGQSFTGSQFPAAAGYRLLIQDRARAVAGKLLERGVLGRFAVDFVVSRTGGRWQAQAIEINLRKGGTTYPAQMLQFLTEGTYHPDDGQFYTPAGETRCYRATDNLQKDAYRRLTPDDLIDVAVRERMQFHRGSQQGVVFSLLGALSEYGKLGMMTIGDTPETCGRLYDDAIRVLDTAADGRGDQR